MSKIQVKVFRKGGRNARSYGVIHTTVKLPFSLRDISKHEETYLREQVIRNLRIALLICFGVKALPTEVEISQNGDQEDLFGDDP